MYQEKLKKELIIKIRRHDELLGQICDRELEAEEKGIEGNLMDVDDEYEGMMVQLGDLEDEINILMLDTKYFPLTGVTTKERKIIAPFTKSSRMAYDAHIERYLDRQLSEVKEGAKRRLRKIKACHLAAQIDPRTHALYRQVVNCYVYGNFEASCVLCRAVVEQIAKRYVEYRGYGQLLSGKNGSSKVITLSGILRDHLSLSTEILSTFSKIARKADSILHNRNERVDEKDALKSVELLRRFINKFPKSV